MPREELAVDVGFDEIKKVSDRALLVVLSDTGEEMWIPRSVIENVDDLVDGVEVIAGDGFDTLVVKQWWARKYGLMED